MTTSIGRALRATLSALGIAAAVTAAATALPDDAAAQEQPEVIRIGSTAPGHLKFILGRSLGLYGEEFGRDGIKVELLPFTGGGGEAATAIASGAIEFAYIGNNPALRLAAAGADVRLIGLSNWVRSGGAGIAVRVDSPIQSVADLRGKKIAYLSGTVRHSYLAKALREVGLTTDDIESLNLNFEASGPALARGDIDAVVESDNTVLRLVEAGEARLILDGNDHPDWSVPHTILVNGAFADRYPELVERLLTVDLRLAQWADDHYEETIRIFVDETSSAEDSVRNNYRDDEFYQNPEITEEAIAAFRSEEAFMEEAGLLEGTVDYDTWIDPSFLEAAHERLAAAVQ